MNRHFAEAVGKIVARMLLDDQSDDPAWLIDALDEVADLLITHTYDYAGSNPQV